MDPLGIAAHLFTDLVRSRGCGSGTTTRCTRAAALAADAAERAADLTTSPAPS
jgi:hypothetical protein